MTSPSSPKRNRRQSSVGSIDLGTSPLSIQTTRSRSSIKHNKELEKELTKPLTSSSDSAIFHQLLLSLRVLGNRHVWPIFLFIMVITYAVYFLLGGDIPGNPLRKFLFIGHAVEVPLSSLKIGSLGEMAGDRVIRNGETFVILYEKGKNDFAFVGFGIIFFTFLREFVMREFLLPLAKHYGLHSKGKVTRFMEQTYACFYYGITGPLGLYIMYNSPLWFFKTSEFWRDYPHLLLPYWFKFFYLFQAGFWTQQSIILMLQLEKPRKDFFELVLHHIITILLVSLSYMFNFTQIGLGIYITMDVSDFFLGLSKTFNYINSPLEVPFFLFFVFIWFYTRHWLNWKMLWSVSYEYLNIGPSILDFNSEQYKCWISLPMVWVLIAALQLLNLYWFALVIRILFRVVVYNVKKDERSDSEDDEEFEE